MQVNGIRPEAQLLLCCARTTLDEVTQKRATSLLSQELDWAYFLRLATRQRVVPLIQRSLSAAQFGAIPPAITAALAQQQDHIARRNFFLTGRLVGLLRTLDTGGIRAIAYKGPAIAAVAYGNISLRQFWDLDVLVQPRDYRRARELLLSRGGYRLRENYGWECSLIDATGIVYVDLHRHIAPDVWPGSLWFDRLWKRRQHVASAGGIPTLSAEDMLVVLSIQLRKDAWERKELRLSKICDIAELLRAWPTLGLELRRGRGQARRLPACALARPDRRTGIARRAGSPRSSAPRRSCADRAAHRLHQPPAVCRRHLGGVVTHVI